MYEQLDIFDLMFPKFQIDKPIRLIELFAGIGSQAMALRDLGIENDGANPPYIREWKARTIEFCVNVRDSIGKTVFLTKEEAETALSELEN